MSGILYLCATPIGNLQDITERVLTTLRSVQLIAAEDTRNSIKLLNHFDIHVPLTSYHEYNKYDKAGELVEVLLSGKDVALITDAGTPAISDPGEVLVRKCVEAGIGVTSLPGASAVITALTLSGLSTARFSFEGFLSRDKKKRKQVLAELKDEVRTIVLYEAPHHLLSTLEDLYPVLGDRKCALCRELTKKHEEVMRCTLSEAISFYKDNDPRGEFVCVFEGRDPEELKKERQKDFSSMTVREHVEMYENAGRDRKEAMKAAAEDRGVSKRDIYNALLREEKGGEEQ